MDLITEAAIFHLNIAAREYKNLKAMTILGTKLIGQETDELEDLQITKNSESGWQLIQQAALFGDKNCIWKMAQRYHHIERNPRKALQWYTVLYDAGTNTPFIRFHMIISSIADIYFKEHGLGLGQNERLELACDFYRRSFIRKKKLNIFIFLELLMMQREMAAYARQRNIQN